MIFKSHNTPPMEKVRSVEEMRVRVENLKKKFGRLYISTLESHYSLLTTNELDKLYLVYYDVRRNSIRYIQSRYGLETEVTYESRKTVMTDYPYTYLAQSYVTTIDASVFNGTSTTACNTAPVTNINSINNRLYF